MHIKSTLTSLLGHMRKLDFRCKVNFRKLLPGQGQRYRVNGNYIMMMKVLYNIASCFLLCPFYLRYDSSQDLYVLQSCHKLQKGACAGILMLSCVSAFKIMDGMTQNLLANPSYIGVYFDFFYGLILHAFYYTIIYYFWFRSDLYARFFNIIQTSPLFEFSTLKTWKVICLPALCWLLTIYLSTFWLIVVLGFKLDGTFANSYEGMARQIFWLKEDDTVPLFLGLVATVSRLYNSLYGHVPFTLFGPCLLFCIHSVTQDWTRVIVSKEGQAKELQRVLKLYRYYKEFIDAANAITGPQYIHFVIIMLCYYSIHLFDALNHPNLIWVTTNYIYLGILTTFLVTPVKSLICGRRIKRWLWEDKHYLNISRTDLSIILHDFSTKRLGVKGGTFFIISPRFSGLIFQHLISYAMIIASQRKRMKII